MTEKIIITPTSTDQSSNAQPILKLGGIDCVERRETEQVLQTEDWFNLITLQFKTEHLTSWFAPTSEQWIGFPTKIASDIIPENENQDWKKQVITLLSPEVQSWIQVEGKLAKIRQEAERAYASDKEIDPVPEEVQSWIQVEGKLAKIRQEAERAYASDKEIDPVPESAYEEALLLAKLLFDNAIPVAHIGWAEDGSIGFEWRPENGIVTVGIYGDNLAIYGIFFKENRQLDGVCSLTDTVLLEGFLETLKRLI